MKILMMVPDDQMIDRRVLQQAASLITAGHTVNLLAGFECREEAEYEDRGVQVHRYRFSLDGHPLGRLSRFVPRKFRLRGLAIRTMLAFERHVLAASPFDDFVLSKAMAFPSDVVHVHDLPLLHLGAQLANQWDVPLVYDAHEIYHEQQSVAGRVRRRLRAIERKHIDRVDLFTTVNEAIAEHFDSLYGRRPLVLMNCADAPPVGFDGEARRRLRERAGLPPEARVLLFQGWFSPERNLLSLVRAMRHLPEDCALVLIGYGEYEKTLRDAVRGQPYEGRVRFLGRVEPERLLPLTAGADVGLIPYQPIDLNHRLCSPNKFFEFVAAGVPIVGPDLVFFRDMAKRYGVVVPGDLGTPEAVARTLAPLLDDPDHLALMRAACRQAARTLNWETEAQKLLQAYPSHGKEPQRVRNCGGLGHLRRAG
jgi:glycosyltransferase involved in cell wall biosynthesis